MNTDEKIRRLELIFKKMEPPIRGMDKTAFFDIYDMEAFGSAIEVLREKAVLEVCPRCDPAGDIARSSLVDDQNKRLTNLVEDLQASWEMCNIERRDLRFQLNVTEEALQAIDRDRRKWRAFALADAEEKGHYWHNQFIEMEARAVEAEHQLKALSVELLECKAANAILNVEQTNLSDAWREGLTKHAAERERVNQVCKELLEWLPSCGTIDTVSVFEKIHELFPYAYPEPESKQTPSASALEVNNECINCACWKDTCDALHMTVEIKDTEIVRLQTELTAEREKVNHTCHELLCWLPTHGIIDIAPVLNKIRDLFPEIYPEPESKSAPEPKMWSWALMELAADRKIMDDKIVVRRFHYVTGPGERLEFRSKGTNGPHLWERWFPIMEDFTVAKWLPYGNR